MVAYGPGFSQNFPEPGLGNRIRLNTNQVNGDDRKVASFVVTTVGSAEYLKRKQSSTSMSTPRKKAKVAELGSDAADTSAEAKWNTAVRNNDAYGLKCMLSPPVRRSQRTLPESSDNTHWKATICEIQRGVWDASSFGKDDALDYLLSTENGGAALSVDNNKVSTLYIAVSHGHEKCVQLLLAKTREWDDVQKAR